MPIEANQDFRKVLRDYPASLQTAFLQVESFLSQWPGDVLVPFRLQDEGDRAFFGAAVSKLKPSRPGYLQIAGRGVPATLLYSYCLDPDQTKQTALAGIPMRYEPDIADVYLMRRSGQSDIHTLAIAANLLAAVGEAGLYTRTQERAHVALSRGNETYASLDARWYALGTGAEDRSAAFQYAQSRR